MIEAKEGHPPLSQKLIVAPGEELKDGWSLRHQIKITSWTTNLLSLRNRAGMLPLGQCSLEDLFTQAADEIPCSGLPIAYDFQRGRRLNVTIIDAARFSLGVGPPVEIPKNVWVNNERLFIQPVELAFLA